MGIDSSSELDALRSLLRKFFRLVADSTKDLYVVDDGFSKQTAKEFREYRISRFSEIIQLSTPSI